LRSSKADLYSLIIISLSRCKRKQNRWFLLVAAFEFACLGKILGKYWLWVVTERTKFWINWMSIHACLLCIMLMRVFQTYSSSIVVNSYTNIREYFSWQDSKRRWFPTLFSVSDILLLLLLSLLGSTKVYVQSLII
jgi:hypothetical protein